MSMETKEIFDCLWNDYTFRNPKVRKIQDLFVHEEKQFANDHIAFYTFYNFCINTDVFSQIILQVGFPNSLKIHPETDSLHPETDSSFYLNMEY